MTSSWFFLSTLKYHRVVSYTLGVAKSFREFTINPLNAELNLVCYLLSLVGAHHIFHVSGLSVKEI